MRTRVFLGTLVALNLLLLGFLLVQDRVDAAQRGGAVLRGQALELTDQNGQVRARINVEADQEVVLRLMDQKGEIRVKLGASEDGSGLVLLNGRTEPGVHAVSKSESTQVILKDASGKEQVLRP